MSTEVPPPPPPPDPAGGSTPGAVPQPPKLKLQPRAPGAPAASGLPVPPPPGAPLPPPPAAATIPRPPVAPVATPAAKLSPTTGPVVAPADPTWIVAIDVVAALVSLGCAVFLAIEIFSKTKV